MESVRTPATTMRPSKRRFALAVLGCWLVWGALYAVKLRALKDGSLLQILHYAFSDALLWALFTPLVLLLARRLPVRPPRLFLRVVQHLALGVAVSFTLLVLDGLQNRWFGLALGKPLSVSAYLRAAVPGWMHSHLMVYATLVAIGHVLEHQRHLLENERSLQLLRTHLAEARLQALRAQLQPHFLFNCLNTIAGLSETRPAEARRTIGNLSELLRFVLRNQVAETVPLGDELHFARTYLALEEVRFGERLRVEIDVPIECEELQVPAFLLQPLVENSVRHGLAPLSRGGRVRIEARRDGEHLALLVADDGVGPGLGSGGNGIGLENIRQRLRELYGEDQACLVLPRAGGGTEVRVRIPTKGRTPSLVTA